MTESNADLVYAQQLRDRIDELERENARLRGERARIQEAQANATALAEGVRLAIAPPQEEYRLPLIEAALETYERTAQPGKALMDAFEAALADNAALLQACQRMLDLDSNCEYAGGEPDVCPGVETEGGPCHWCEMRAAVAMARREG